MRLFETTMDHSSRPWEREISYENVQNVGFMCTVDLFPLPESAYAPRSPSSHSLPTSSYVGYPYDESRQDEPPTTYTYFPLHPYVSSSAEGGQASQPPFQLPRRQLMLSHLKEEEFPPDVVYQVGNHLITESSKLTPAVVGEKVVEPTIVDYKGRKAMIFVFGDIAVRREGVFILRYRAFDIFSGVESSQHAPILAELYGGPFKVYSTREFPGLEPSTELTKDLSKYGVRVTLRDAERKSRKRSKDFDS
ncbi:velvet factor [Crepidotus variabilis]|uniref:Velvet factor n=1 Tax=Crepidotus variabilis TaxID=179855 RepID=A0A9P6JMR3_9AGAR|nr:velvet factor [Crepidotus variabilis]